MAYDGWLRYNGVELVNISRTAQLAEVMGISAVWTLSEDVQWIEDRFGGADYSDVTTAPWYDSGYTPSREFAGLVPLSFAGLGDSTAASTVTEYVGDGAALGQVRSASLPIVASVGIAASTQAGAEFGLRWLTHLLRQRGVNNFCTGTNLDYLRYEGSDAPQVHLRNVGLTRAPSVTRQKADDCSVIWLVTFTLTAGDSYEYGELTPGIDALGAEEPTGPSMSSHGDLTMLQTSCPRYDYTPIYDPLYPALIPSPTAPDFLPDGWGIEDGMTFLRQWARFQASEPSEFNSVPLIELSSTQEARMVRVSIWPGDSPADDQCDPLFSAVVSYLPPDTPFYIDGEQQASYAWDGFSPAVRRTDSLVYSPEAAPVVWTAFQQGSGLLVTLDTFAVPEGGFQGGGTVRATFGLVPKSD